MPHLHNTTAMMLILIMLGLYGVSIIIGIFMGIHDANVDRKRAARWGRGW